MAKSGYLPDISSTFAFWRSYAVNCLEKKNNRGDEAALYNINACLTEEYIITINKDKYEEQINDNIIYECIKCKAYTTYKDVRFGDLLLPHIDQCVLGKETVRVWQCTKCKELIELEYTSIIKEQRVSPYFQRFMYECPYPAIGMLLHYKYTPAFQRWFFKFLELLQHQLHLYRIEYVSQHGEEMKDPAGYVDQGDLIASHN